MPFPSPTSALFATIVDTFAPDAPVPSVSVLSTDGTGAKLLRISWTKTVHNGTYYISRLDNLGNWLRIGTVATNDPVHSFDLSDALPSTTGAGDPIFYRFKIDAQSSGGRLNLRDAPVTVNLATL